MGKAEGGEYRKMIDDTNVMDPNNNGDDEEEKKDEDEEKKEEGSE